MARAGLLHVTVITATLLRDTAGSDVEPADTYASVGCGSQNFTTNSVKNHRAKPSWNESHTFKFEERNELESQHILIEIFAEKPKLDELLGLAKIPIQKVINIGDEISTHSLNRPDEEYIGHEQYSGHVKVALRWDAAQQASAPAYPQTYTPAARYNPNASTGKVATHARQTSRSDEKLQTSKSGAELHHPEDIYGADQDRRVHHRSSSYPSLSHSFRSSAPSPSQSSWTQPPTMDESSTPVPGSHPSTSQAPKAHPLPGTAPRHSSFEARSNVPPQQEHGRGPSPHVPYAGPHVPYVPHEGNKTRNGTPGHGHAAYVESGSSISDPKQQEDLAKLKLSKSKQAEMAKLAELSRLTESAKIQATGFAKAGQQTSTRPRQSLVQPQPSQASSGPNKQNDVSAKQPNQGSSKQKSDVPQVQQQNQAPQAPKKDDVQPQQRLTGGSQRFEQSKQLTVVPTMLDIVQTQPQKSQRDEKQGQLTSQRSADVYYEKAIQKVDKPEQKKKSSSFRRTLKILRKTSKIFGI